MTAPLPSPTFKHPLLALPQMMAMIQCQLQSWPAGLSYANSASPLWKPSSGSSQAIPAEILTALANESQRRSGLFLRGVTHYLYSPCPGPQPDNARRISTSFCNFHLYRSSDARSAARPIVLCIPSLINRYTILDLNRESSFVDFINHTGFDCLVVEWPPPTIDDADTSMADYVMKLVYALQECWDQINKPVVALGYCMGGVISLALSQLFARIEGLALLATPWNYGAYPCAGLSAANVEKLEKIVLSAPLLKAETLQGLLYLANPYRLYQRYTNFSLMRNEQEIAQFVAVEHWANEGVDIPRKVAKECLLDWPRRNTLLDHHWQIEGEMITPSAIRVPAFIALPCHDHIVPKSSAEPLAKAVPGAQIITPGTGHVGMIVGRKRHELLSPLSVWLLKNYG